MRICFSATARAPATAPRPLRGQLGRRRPSGLAEAAVGAEDKTCVAGEKTIAGALLRLPRVGRHRRDARAHRYARPEKSEAQLRELALKVELTKNKTLGPGRHRRFGGIHQWEGVQSGV